MTPGRLREMERAAACGRAFGARLAGPCRNRQARQPMHRSLALTLLACAALCTVQAWAAPPLLIRADHASGRAFAADLAHLYEVKRGVQSRVEAIGTMSALEAVASGEAAVAASARPGDDAFESERALRFVPVAWDALVLVVFPKNPVASLSLVQLRDVLAGRITDWRELGGKPGLINLYTVAAPYDGVEYSLKRLVFGSPRSQFAAKRWYLNTERLEEAVSIDPAGLGVSLYADVVDNPGVKMLAIEGTAPSPAAVADGSYVLATPLYLAVLADTARSLEGQRFIEFLDEDSDAHKRLAARHLLIGPQAQALAQTAPQREAFLADRLGYELSEALAAVAPLPPPPAKPGPANALRADNGPVTRPLPALAPAAKAQSQPVAQAAPELRGARACLEALPCQ